MQRFIDILLSSIALLLLLPLLAPVCVILRLTGEGEVFYFQERIGMNGNAFKIVKFATMLKNSPNIGAGTVTLKNDDRVLPVGKFLRKTKVNELPQLINILVGHMSLIGPRPLTLQTFLAYSKSTQNIIKQVRPGLSGIGSIIFRDEEQIMSGADANFEFYAHTIAPYKGKLEIWYTQHQNLYVYIMLILMTIWYVIFPNSRLVWLLFNDLPPPPAKLVRHLNFK